MAENCIVSVNPKPSKGLSSKLLDLVERVVVKLMHDASLPLHYLSGNFAPVRDETPPVKDLPVVHGFLPVSELFNLHTPYPFPRKVLIRLFYISQECLNGEFVRVGPNPKFDPVAGYHWHVYLLPFVFFISALSSSSSSSSYYYCFPFFSGLMEMGTPTNCFYRLIKPYDLLNSFLFHYLSPENLPLTHLH